MRSDRPEARGTPYLHFSGKTEDRSIYVVRIFVSCYTYGHRMRLKTSSKMAIARIDAAYLSLHVDFARCAERAAIFNDELQCVLTDVRDAVCTYYSLDINNPLKVTGAKGSVYPGSSMSTAGQSSRLTLWTRRLCPGSHAHKSFPP